MQHVKKEHVTLVKSLLSNMLVSQNNKDSKIEDIVMLEYTNDFYFDNVEKMDTLFALFVHI